MSGRVRLVLAGLGMAGVFLGVMAAGGLAEVPATVDVYGGTAWAAGVHQISGTDAFPNFGSGAVNNRYPMAGATEDAAPGSSATASANDYGPLAATVAPGQVADYARAQWPNPPGKPDDVKSDGAGNSYEAHAKELASDAKGFYNGGGSSPFQNVTAETHTIINPDGSEVVTTHSHVGSADFGAVKVTNTDVVTKIVSLGGKVTISYSINAGNVLANGTPVTVGDSGITVGGTPVPSLLPGGLGTTTPVIKVFTVQPEKSSDGPSGTIMATGLHVGVTQPGGAGVPSQYTEYILGEGFAQGFAIPASLNIRTVPSADLTSTDTGAAPIGAIITDTVAAPVNPTTYQGAAPPLPTVVPAKPKPIRRAVLAAVTRPDLALMFFIWEALVMATAGSIVWARRLKRAEDVV